MTPVMDLDTARAMMLRPDLHSRDGLRGACTAAEMAGDWIDMERARQLRARLDAEQEERTDRVVIELADVAGVIGLGVPAPAAPSAWLGAGQQADRAEGAVGTRDLRPNTQPSTSSAARSSGRPVLRKSTG